MKESLTDNRQVTLLLRLVLAQTGRLVHGEALDLSGRSLGRFRAWEELEAVVRRAPRDQGPA
jgi:hypothetical protein